MVWMEWSGGLSPFKVQAREHLDTTWRDISPAIAQRFYHGPVNGDHLFYRIQCTTNLPPDPPRLTGTSVGCALISLRWTVASAAAASIESFQIYRDGQLQVVIGASSRFWIDQTLEPLSMYRYTITARDNIGVESSASSSIYVSTPACTNTTDSGFILGVTGLGCDWLMLWWDPNDAGTNGWVAYNVYRDGLKMDQVPATSAFWIDQTVVAGTSYEYGVKGVDSDQVESADTAVSRVEVPDCTNVVFTAALEGNPTGCDQALLWWGGTNDLSTNGFSGYQIYRNGVVVGQTQAPTNFWADLSLLPEASYEYRVTGLDASGLESGPSEILAISTPSCESLPVFDFSLVLRDVNCSEISLGWGTNSVATNEFVAYRIYRDGIPVAHVSAPTNVWIDTVASTLTTYRYLVTGMDAAGRESEPSDPLVVTSPACDSPLLFSAGLEGRSLQCDGLTLWWNTNVAGMSDFATFQVYRDDALVGENVAETNFWTDDGLAPLTTYRYMVIGVDSLGNKSAPSDPLILTTPACEDVSVVGISLDGAAAPCLGVALWWDSSSSNATKWVSYRIYRDDLEVARVDAATHSWIDPDVVSLTTYHYTLSGVDRYGRVSIPSDPLVLTTSECTPDTNRSLTLAWDSDTMAGITGYAVHYGLASGLYLWRTTVTDGTVATISGLSTGISYYFAVTAFNQAGEESPLSDELVYSPP